jgi:NAD+ synthase (glutamine-hydrolysing)
MDILERILSNKECNDILIDVGLPIMHRGLRFNCRVLAVNGKILYIRPKLFLAGDGNYREMRWFAPWNRPNYTEDYYITSLSLRKLQRSRTVPIGDCVLSTPDTCLGAETCEELFTPNAPHNNMSLNGVEIITNSSGSHYTLRKLNTRLQLIVEATRKNGGLYL